MLCAISNTTLTTGVEHNDITHHTHESHQHEKHSMLCCGMPHLASLIVSGIETITSTTTHPMTSNDDDVVIGTNMYTNINHGPGFAQEQGLGQEKNIHSKHTLNMFSLQHVRSQPLSDVIPPPSSATPDSLSYGGYQRDQQGLPGYHRIGQEEEES